jgi:hypothetical protein
MCRDSREKYFPLCFIVRILDGSMYSSRAALSIMAESDQEPSQSLRGVSGCYESKWERRVLIKHTHIFIRLGVSFIVLNWRVDTNRFEGCFLPARDYVPAEPSSSHVIERAEAFGE